MENNKHVRFIYICFLKTYAYVGLNIQKERRVEEREEVSIRHPKKKNIEMVSRVIIYIYIYIYICISSHLNDAVHHRSSWLKLA
jgi:hypothetical protein